MHVKLRFWYDSFMFELKVFNEICGSALFIYYFFVRIGIKPEIEITSSKLNASTKSDLEKQKKNSKMNKLFPIEIVSWQNRLANQIMKQKVLFKILN